jgi:hypothetical protein
MRRRSLILGSAAAGLLAARPSRGQADPLPSWNDSKPWDEAVRRGWSIVDMKNDWKVVYPFELK